MLNYSDKKKEYLRITTRFLKEVGLYNLWVKYYNTHKMLDDCWIENLQEDLCIQDILGNTSFTNFVRRHTHLRLRGYAIYEIFGEYLRKTKSKYIKEVDEYSNNMLNVDVEGKKITWNDLEDSW